MTRYEAIKILEYPVKKWSMEWDEREDGLSYYEALDMAISALRQQETVTNRNGLNDPLTLDELRKMDGEPVWCVSLGAKLSRGDGWYIGVNNWYMGGYGKKWLAYRQKPEEGTE